MSDRRMQDELAVRNLANAYSHAVMRLDAEAAAAVYAEDGVLSAFNFPESVGRATIARNLTMTLAPIQFIIQTCAAGVVDIDGDQARANWSVTEWLQFKGKDELSCCFGVYEDTAVRTAEGWRFKRRRFHPFFRGSVPATGRQYDTPAFAHSFAPWPFLGGAAVG